MKKVEFPIGKKKEIISMYNDRSIKVKEILETYKINNSQLCRILREENVPFRMPKNTGPRTNIKLGKCPTCGKNLMASDAKYCCYCGCNVQTESDRLIERLGDLWAMVYPLFRPYNKDDDVLREKAILIINDVKEYLKNH